MPTQEDLVQGNIHGMGNDGADSLAYYGLSRERPSQQIMASAPGMIKSSGFLAPLIGWQAGKAYQGARASETQGQQALLQAVRDIHIGLSNGEMSAQQAMQSVLGVAAETGADPKEVLGLMKQMQQTGAAFTEQGNQTPEFSSPESYQEAQKSFGGLASIKEARVTLKDGTKVTVGGRTSGIDTDQLLNLGKALGVDFGGQTPSSLETTGLSEGGSEIIKEFDPKKAKSYQVGDVLNINGKKARVIGKDSDGMPLADFLQ